MWRIFCPLLITLLFAAPSWAGPSKTQVKAALEVLQEAVDDMGGSGLVKRYSLAELENLIRAEGYKNIRVRESGSIIFAHDDTNYMLQLYDDGDLQLYYGASGLSVTVHDMNEWNVSKRLSRAYIDSDGDPGLESDLLANGGLSEEIVKQFIGVFVNTSAPAFEEYIRERSQ
ncbi:YbjN domain-containing protein [Corallincola platygyrae]|uniref:YbjN domain-containing protein n=1 Tax=Corallincola platygyrae TaxID=1193278 RepID=A0ABW4XN85_9GAMM